MKKCMLLVVLLAVSGMANAMVIPDLLVNGDFEDPDGSGWSQWWGGNSSKYAPDPIEGDNCAGTWWMDDGIFQTIPLGAQMYTVSGDIMQENLGNGRIGVIKAEIKDGAGNIWWVQEIAITENDLPGTWYSDSMVIDNTTAGASQMTINLFMYDTNGWGSGVGIVRYDNISVVPEPATMGLLALGGLLLRRRCA